MTDALLQVRNLQTSFFTELGEVKAVDGVDFDVPPGKTLGIVGESGSGKSITALSILQLIQKPGKITGGSIIFDGIDLLSLPPQEMRKIRGNQISMIFQEPMTSLNPVFKIGDQLDEALNIYKQSLKAEQIKARSIEMLNLVGIADPEKVYNNFPHELSGGMRQRIMIAMALICEPRLIIADEPTTALDVTIQAQILDLLLDVKNKINGSIMLITHDLGVIASMADFVVVMYAGKIVESGEIHDIFNHPKHPYTVGLMSSLPSLSNVEGKQKLYSIPGQVPSAVNLPDYCYFCNRCDYSFDACYKAYPDDVPFENEHHASCFLYDEKYKDLNLNRPELPKNISGSADAQAARKIPQGRVDIETLNNNPKES